MRADHNLPVIHLRERDNVAVAKSDLPVGAVVSRDGLVSRAPIPAGHKVAVRSIPKGDPILKYETVIGFAGDDIRPGDHVHRHNVAFHEYERDYAFCADARPIDYVPEAARASFQGIVRPDGRVATRNYVGILSTVNCSATVVRAIADHFRNSNRLVDKALDGVVAFTHSTGCGMGASGEGYDTLQRTMAGYARHPNLAGVLFVGLGCERNQIDSIFQNYGLAEGPHLKAMAIQDEGGTRATIREGIAAIEALIEAAPLVERRSVPASHITVGLQCGGSDGYSSITANPALGAAMDILVRHGGTAVLSETPEIYGVEQNLTRRAASPEVAQKILDRIAWWKEYTRGQTGQMNNNPSPGNQAGGLASIFEKALGSSMKGGTTTLQGVYHYAEPIAGKGFVFMDSPGFDPCSATGQVASGANVICFTPGRGSAYGCKPVPSLKLATNTPLYRKMTEDMDVNCGEILDGTASMAEVGERIFAMILDTASGKPTKSEELGLGDNEFVPWQLGAVF